MSRNLSTELITEIESDTIRFLLFVKLEFDSGTIYLHNGIGTLTWDSNDWLGVGDFGSIEQIQEGTELSPYSLVLLLSGLDASLMDEALNQDYYLRPVTLYFGSLDTSTGALVADPDELWSGKMDSADVALGAVNGIRLTCESDFAVFDQANNSRYSDAHQQRDYPGDLLFQYMEQMVDTVLVWGGKKLNITVAPPGAFDQFDDAENYNETR